MLMARMARLSPDTRLLLDKRGFFADERVESGSWRSGSMIDRAVRAVEEANLRRADGMVVLTEAAVAVLQRKGAPLPPHRVIPTCVDTTVFRPREEGETPDHGVVYSGSLGTWYMVSEMVALAKALTAVVPGKALFLTPQVQRAINAGATPDWAQVHSADPFDVPGWMRRARASLFLIRPTPAKRASSPTKLGEALACGLPVVANRGIGDVDSLLEREAVGVLLDEINDSGYRRAAKSLADLLADPLTPQRCRRLAEARFGLALGVAEYRSLYQELAPS
jgi:glycosyltransferase involved in cell wall biosynthesis